MSKRRGGAPAAATGLQWRQQQERAALEAALRQLPGAGAPPQRLLAGLQRALLCVEHTLNGPPCGGLPSEGASAGDGDVQLGSVTAVGSVDGAATVTASLGPVGLAVHTRDELMSMAAQRAIGELRELLASEVAAAQAEAQAEAGAEAERAAAAGSAGGDLQARVGWDSVAFLTALLHHLLALSSDLLEGVPVERSAEAGEGAVATASGGSPGWTLRRDELAAAARPRLPLAVYGRIVAGMGWEEQLLDLLAWIPDPRVGEVAVERVLAGCPGLAQGLAAALAADMPREAPEGEVARACRRPWWRPGGGVLGLAESPAVLTCIANAVRHGAATATAAGERGGCGGDEAAAVGAGWVPCLVLLGRSLASRLGSPAIANRRPAAAANSSSGDDLSTACCEALQEGLCAWQAAVVAAAAAGEDSAGDGENAVAGSGCACGLLALLQRLLLPLLDEQGRLHIAAQLQAGQQGGEQQRQPLLPYASVIRLRSRIALMVMAAPSPPASQTAAGVAEGGEERAGEERSVAASVPTMSLAADDVWRNLPSGAAAATQAVLASTSDSGPSVMAGAAAGWRRRGSAAIGAAPAPGQALSAALGEGQAQRDADRLLPAWLRAATLPSARTKGSGPLACLRGLSPSVIAPTNAPRPTPASVAESAARPSAATGAGLAAARLAAVAVALLTPGMASWLSVQSGPQVAAAAGCDPYSAFRAALALLELLQGVLALAPEAYAKAAVGGLSGEERTAPGGPPDEGASAEVRESGSGERRQQHHTAQDGPLWLLGLRMAAECIACVAATEQQAALQAVLLAGPGFRSLQSRLSADASLQAAAGRALVALSNRSAALEGSLERLALSAAAEAQRLAAAARELLPFAALTPAACVRRLLLDGLAHPGQQPWVLQLLRCFAAAAAAAPPAAPAAPAALPPPALLACLQDMLGDSERLLRSAADRRSLLTLLEGLVRCGVATPRALVAEVALPALQDAASASEGGRLAVLQVQAALLVVQQTLRGAAGTSASAFASAHDSMLPPPYHYDPAAVLAASRPAALLLAVAAALERLYGEYDTAGQLEAAVIDVAAGVLEHAAQLYGGHLAASRSLALGAGAKGGFGEAAASELAELSASCQAMSRRLLAALLPVLEAAAVSAAATAAAASYREDGSGGKGSIEQEQEELEVTEGALRRELVGRLAPAAAWRPRTLRGADPRAAHAVVYDTLAFAASSAGHAVALRAALLEAAAEAEAEAAADAGVALSSEARGAGADAGLWSAWSDGAAEVAFAAQEYESGSGGGSQVARHVASTAARGLPQLPPARLAAALVSGLAALLPTSSQAQARRLLIVALPALVRAAGGAAALAAAARSAPAGSSRGPAGLAGGDDAGNVLEEVLAHELTERSSVAGTVADGSRADTAAADVALSVALACRAAASALRPGGTEGANGGSGGDEAGAPAAAPALGPTADRCASHLSLLASQLARVAADAAKPQPRSAQGAGAGPGCGAARQVAAVASVLLAELCGVAAVAAEAAEAEAPGSSTRGLDVWQAVILSVLQHLASALAAELSSTAWPPQAAATDASSTEWVRRTLRRVAHALRRLPGAAPEVLWGALERLCEEQPHGQESDRDGGSGPQVVGSQQGGVRELLVAAVEAVGAEVLP